MSLALIKSKVKATWLKATAGFTAALGLVATQSALAAYEFGNLVDTNGGVEEVAENTTNLFEIAFNVVKAFAVLAGLVLIFIGIMKIKKSQDPNSGVSVMTGIVYLIVGGLLGVLPWVLIVMSSTFA